MSFTRRLFSLTSYYSNINPNMISGACDTIVTRTADGTMRATPFYIRFGKKHIFRLANHRVVLFVNGRCCQMAIRVNKYGSVVFEREDDESEQEEFVERVSEDENERGFMKRYNLDICQMYEFEERLGKRRSIWNILRELENRKVYNSNQNDMFKFGKVGETYTNKKVDTQHKNINATKDNNNKLNSDKITLVTNDLQDGIFCENAMHKNSDINTNIDKMVVNDKNSKFKENRIATPFNTKVELKVNEAGKNEVKISFIEDETDFISPKKDELDNSKLSSIDDVKTNDEISINEINGINNIDKYSPSIVENNKDDDLSCNDNNNMAEIQNLTFNNVLIDNSVLNSQMIEGCTDLLKPIENIKSEEKIEAKKIENVQTNVNVHNVSQYENSLLKTIITEVESVANNESFNGSNNIKLLHGDKNCNKIKDETKKNYANNIIKITNKNDATSCIDFTADLHGIKSNVIHNNIESSISPDLNEYTMEKPNNKITTNLSVRNEIEKEKIKNILTGDLENDKKFVRILRVCMSIEDIFIQRKKNKDTRLYFLHKKPSEYEDLSVKYNTFNGMLTSNQHLDFLTESHKGLFNAILGLIFPNKDKIDFEDGKKEKINNNKDGQKISDNDTSNYNNLKFSSNTNQFSNLNKVKRTIPNNSNSNSGRDIKSKNIYYHCEDGNKKGCVNVEATFSSCYKQKFVNNNYKETFEKYRQRSLEKTDNLIVKIKGCSKCKFEYYIFYDLFTEIFFYLRNLIFTDCKSKKNKFEEFLEKKINEKRGYSFFKKVTKRKEYHDTFTMSDSQLKRLNLKEGKNELTFQVDGSCQALSIDCYLWNDRDRIVVSDIDGTITKSDAWGHVYALIGKDWTHYGVAELFTRIKRNEFKLVYLSSRPIEQIEYTKKYLRKINQDGFKLPEGPVLLSPNGIFGAIYTELILKRPEEFKIACLKNVRELFNENPFYSGFGNRRTDIITYKSVGIATNKIFTVNPKGTIQPEYSLSRTGSYMSLNALVNNVFPTRFNTIEIENHKWWLKKL
ncbi:lipin Ned1 [Conglomerata obtusa]